MDTPGDDQIEWKEEHNDPDEILPLLCALPALADEDDEMPEVDPFPW